MSQNPAFSSLRIQRLELGIQWPASSIGLFQCWLESLVSCIWRRAFRKTDHATKTNGKTSPTKFRNVTYKGRPSLWISALMGRRSGWRFESHYSCFSAFGCQLFFGSQGVEFIGLRVTKKEWTNVLTRWNLTGSQLSILDRRMTEILSF